MTTTGDNDVKNPFPIPEPGEILPPEVRGGNDMASGSENWDDIEGRITDPRAQMAERREVPMGAEPSGILKKDHTENQKIFFGDSVLGLVRLMNQSFVSTEEIKKLLNDRDLQVDEELCSFLREMLDVEQQRVEKFKKLLGTRLYKNEEQVTH